MFLLTAIHQISFKQTIGESHPSKMAWAIVLSNFGALNHLLADVSSPGQGTIQALLQRMSSYFNFSGPEKKPFWARKLSP